ncbi:VanZ family protein [Embleya sp. NBC_00896]|uniref:VanZ family protein n=1 Tax=Embleya sp. NBC_00896 TaxID=2975961 RepID=UPI003868E46A|nr:VanZ family protein [Embleya sp. NBC_00896]
MGGIWSQWGTVLVGGAIALPIVAVLAVLRPRAGVVAGLVVGTAPWVWMVLTPVGDSRAVSVVPLRDLLTVLRADPTTAVVQVGGNLLVFAALGCLLPVYSARFAGRAGRWRVAGVAALSSTAIELAQWVLAIGRVSSVDDVLLNTAGALAAAVLSGLRRPAAKPARTGAD